MFVIAIFQLNGKNYKFILQPSENVIGFDVY